MNGGFQQKSIHSTRNHHLSMDSIIVTSCSFWVCWSWWPSRSDMSWSSPTSTRNMIVQLKKKKRGKKKEQKKKSNWRGLVERNITRSQGIRKAIGGPNAVFKEKWYGRWLVVEGRWHDRYCKVGRDRTMIDLIAGSEPDTAPISW